MVSVSLIGGKYFYCLIDFMCVCMMFYDVVTHSEPRLRNEQPKNLNNNNNTPIWLSCSLPWLFWMTAFQGGDRGEVACWQIGFFGLLEPVDLM